MRTCVGCGKREPASALVRLVLGPGGDVAFDLSGGCVGRGAHAHPHRDCLDKAARRGLARSFRTRVVIDVATLQVRLVEAARRRTWGLLSSAVRSRHVWIGREAVAAAIEDRTVQLVVVACDANLNDLPPPICHSVAAGHGVAFGTRADLGALCGRAEVAMLGIRSPRLARAVAEACRIADSAQSVSEVR